MNYYGDGLNFQRVVAGEKVVGWQVGILNRMVNQESEAATGCASGAGSVTPYEGITVEGAGFGMDRQFSFLNCRYEHRVRDEKMGQFCGAVLQTVAVKLQKGKRMRSQ